MLPKRGSPRTSQRRSSEISSANPRHNVLDVPFIYYGVLGVASNVIWQVYRSESHLVHQPEAPHLKADGSGQTGIWLWGSLTAGEDPLPFPSETCHFATEKDYDHRVPLRGTIRPSVLYDHVVIADGGYTIRPPHPRHIPCAVRHWRPDDVTRNAELGDAS